MKRLTYTGIAMLAAAAFAANAGAAIDKPGPGFLGPPLPAPVVTQPGLTGPVKAPIVLPPPTLASPPIKSPAPASTPTLTSNPIKVPAF